MKRIDVEEYRKICNEYHHNKYDYSLVNLKDNKIKIICPIHGLFEQNKTVHKRSGCWNCSVELRSKNQTSTKEKFIEKAYTIHGDKYDYSSVYYKNNNTKVNIICKNHGIFEQMPYSHLSGNGCHICGVISTRLKNKHSTELFIEKAKKIHGDAYDYSKVDYLNNNSFVTIICKNHGEFRQLPNNHLSGQNCGKCYGNHTISKEEFIEKCMKIHNDVYNYSLVDYNNSNSIIKIICKKHGIFFQKANNHLNSKQGCPKCSGLNKTTEDFINESSKIHGDIFDYSKVEYNKAKEHVIIICKKHGEFKQAPTHHLSGQGCPVCKSSKGEKIINDILFKKGIDYKHHYIFKDFTNYEYDFFIPLLNLCIEYDGIQHFKPNNHFGGIKSFEEQKRRDSKKDEYCLINNIKLIRIPYTEKDIEKILDNEFTHKLL